MSSAGLIRQKTHLNAAPRVMVRWGTGSLMLQKLGDHIAACLERADKCIAASTVETDPRVQTQLLDLAQQWRHVAKNYEFVASLEKFLVDQQNAALPSQVEKLPKEGPGELQTRE